MPAPQMPPRQCNERCQLFREARALNPDPPHAFQVRRNARRLFLALHRLHKLGDPEWKLLEAGALLHDIGQRVDYRSHHKHSRDLILSRPWPGLSEEERAIVACLARYHRKRFPRPDDKVYRDLSPTMQQVVQKLGGILRIADGLDRAHAASVRAIGAQVTPGAVHLLVVQRTQRPADLLAAMKKSDLFSRAFDATLEISPVTPRFPWQELRSFQTVEIPEDH